MLAIRLNASAVGWYALLLLRLLAIGSIGLASYYQSLVLLSLGPLLLGYYRKPLSLAVLPTFSMIWPATHGPWRLARTDGSEVLVALRPESYARSGFCWLSCRDLQRSCSYHVVIMRDSTDPESYRLLQLCLRYPTAQPSH